MIMIMIRIETGAIAICYIGFNVLRLKYNRERMLLHTIHIVAIVGSSGGKTHSLPDCVVNCTGLHCQLPAIVFFFAFTCQLCGMFNLKPPVLNESCIMSQIWHIYHCKFLEVWGKILKL